MYGTEVAEVYDLIHEARGKDFGTEAEQIAGLVRSRHPGADSLLDVACGTGAHLRAFGRFFPRTEGLELSEPMVGLARTRVPGTTVHHADMRDFELGRTFDAITCMFGSIGYLATVAELEATLRRFARHLSARGVVVVDPWWFAESYLDGYVAGGAVTAGGCTVARVSHSTRDGKASRMEVHYLVASADAGVKHFSEIHVITLFARREYEDAFARAGLRAEYLAGLQQGRGLFVATRS